MTRHKQHFTPLPQICLHLYAGIHATVDGQNITITQAMISNTYEFDDLDASKWYSEKRVRIYMDMMGYNVKPHKLPFQ
ncbi:hypothetical protein Hanom_Chr01g00021271 [Helianthus anomalus]